MRLGEALGLLHGDWVTGRGDTPYVNVIPREHPHGQRVKSGLPRRIYVTDRVDRLYGEYLWQLCDAGADVVLGDMDRALVFVNLAGGELFAPWRPGSVYSLVARLKRTWSTRCRRAGRRTGFGIRTRRLCFWLASRCMSSRGDWATPTCRPQ